MSLNNDTMRIRSNAGVTLTGEALRWCPICEKPAEEFCRVGLRRREDALCPHCHSLERHRLLWLFLQKKTRFFRRPPKRMLHVAPEKALTAKFRAAVSSYVSADLLDSDADITMDICDIDFPDRSFDFVYCSHVLEHVDDDRKAIREFRRILTHRGMAILLVPIVAKKTFEDFTVTDPEERIRLFGQADHVRVYGPDYEDRLREEGFEVEKVEPKDFLTPVEIRRMAITPPSGSIYVCRRPRVAPFKKLIDFCYKNWPG